MNRDPNARHNGYTSWSYCDALDRGLLPNYCDRDLYMQDNAPIHKAQMTRAWLAENQINVVTFPRYSPDLNPIEHM